LTFIRPIYYKNRHYYEKGGMGIQIEEGRTRSDLCISILKRRI